jgi:phosphomannomutase
MMKSKIENNKTVPIPEKLTDTLNLSMFKAHDIRTPAKNLMPKLAKRLALAEAYYFRNVLKTNTIVLCRDARLTGETYLQIGQETFCDLGFEVLVVPVPRSTCHFYYCCMRHPEAAGIMYGASHNLGEDNGQKIVGPDVTPIGMGSDPDVSLAKIRQLYIDGVTPESREGGTINEIDYCDDYITYSMKMAGVRPGDLKGCHILMDFLHGSAGDEFIRAFSLAGASIDSLHAKPDGSFPVGPPNPIVPKSIASGLKKLKQGDYHLGMFFDGDGDRIEFYTNSGELLRPSSNVSIISPMLLHAFKENSKRLIPSPYVYSCIKGSPITLKNIIMNNIGCELIGSGHSQIKRVMGENTERGCLAAVEESGHYYMNFPLEDRIYSTENTLFFGLLTTLSWLQSAEAYNKVLSLQKKLFREREWAFFFPNDTARNRALEDIKEAFLRHGGQSISRTKEGLDLGGTLMRKGLTFSIEKNTDISQDWVQIAQRVSECENGLARWEVMAGNDEQKSEMVQLINDIVARYTSEERYVG